MRSNDEIIRLQAQHHECVNTEGFETPEEYLLYLMHLRAYEEAVAEFVDETKVILDLGCNTGYGSAFLAASAREVVGADVSESALAEARDRYGSVQNLSFVQTDGKTVPFESGTFDGSTSMQVIEHVGDYEPYLSEIRRLLRPEGVAVFSTPNARLRLDDPLRPWNRFHVREFDAADLQALLRRYFSEVDIRGLHAVEELDALERQRVSRARLAAREAPRTAFSRLVSRGRPLRRLLTWWDRGGSRATPDPSTHELASVQRYSTKDLWYTTEQVDEALDLLAVCRV